MSTFERSLSGLPGLDSMLDSIRMGDNVVWQVSSMDDYMHFVIPLYAQLHKDGKELLYMHFSGHPVLQDLVEAEIFYTALFDSPKTRIFNRNIFHNMPNMLMKILPNCKEYEDIVKVCHTEGMHLKLYSDIQNTETVLGFES